MAQSMIRCCFCDRSINDIDTEVGPIMDFGSWSGQAKPKRYLCVWCVKMIAEKLAMEKLWIPKERELWWMKKDGCNV